MTKREVIKMVLPANHPELPWIGVFFGCIWLANIFYWGCNQFITQKALAAKNLTISLKKCPSLRGRND